MITKSVFCINLSYTELKSLVEARPFKGSYWKTPPNNIIRDIKNKIKEQLEDVQENCAYCGLKFGGTSHSQIEHIAPKADNKYPQFTFLPKNLVLSCGYCNGFYKKGNLNTIDQLNRPYEKSEFNIVHPYLDDPKDHFSWDDEHVRIIISVNNNSAKGKKSIDVFGLDTVKMSELRAQQMRFEEFKVKYSLNQQDDNLVERILKI